MSRGAQRTARQRRPLPGLPVTECAYCRAIAIFGSALVSGINSPDRSIVTRLMVPLKANASLHSSGA